MPARWFVPVRGLDPHRTRLEHVHAAFSAWFDRSDAEHGAGEKPYSISPLTERDGQVGVIIGTLTDYAAESVCAAGILGDAGMSAGMDAPRAAEERPMIRLGNQWRPVGRPRRLEEVSWWDLAQPRDVRSWRLEFLTPATFRSGDRSSPLPSVATITGGLERAWTTWCEDPRVRDLTRDLTSNISSNLASNPRGQSALWVSDLDLSSTLTEITVGRSRRPIQLSGVTGSMTLRVDDTAGAAWAGPLLRLAPFCGVGSMRAKGFGVVEVRAGRRVGQQQSA